MFEYNGMIHQGGPDYSRVIMKGFFNHFEKTEDAMFYLIKGLEMIHHELYNEYANEMENDKDPYPGKYYKKEPKCRQLARAIDELKGTA